MKSSPYPSTRRALAVWSTAMLANAISIACRTSLSALSAETMAHFGVGAAELSSFVYLQLLVYAAMQLPAGAVVDRFGPKVALAASCAILAVSQTGFAFAGSLPTAIGSRVVLGVGDALSYIALMRVTMAWFRPALAPLMGQVTSALSIAGQLVALYPLAWCVRTRGWADGFLSLAISCACSCVLVVIVVRDTPRGHIRPAFGSGHVGGNGKPFGRMSLWQRYPGVRVGFWTMLLTVFSGMTFTTLWGYPMLTDGLGLAGGTATMLMTLLTVVNMLWVPVLGRLPIRFPARGRSYMALFATGLQIVAWLWAMTVRPGGAGALAAGVLLVAALGTSLPLGMFGIDVLRESVPADRLGMATGLVNSAGFLGTIVAVASIGVIMGVAHLDIRMASAVQLPIFAVAITGFVRDVRRYNAENDGKRRLEALA